MYWKTFHALLLAALLAGLPLAASAQWDLSKSRIDVDDIRAGGPPKDGIPALTEPKFIPAAEAHWLRDDDDIIGFAVKTDRGVEARAYPLRIMSWHESVNDRIGGKPYLVSW